MGINRHIKINQTINDKLVAILSNKYSTLCMHPQCRHKAVKSHAISKSALNIIAQKGKVITPKSKRNDAQPNKKIQFESVGINDATTFRGFCDDHEMMFEAVDKRGIVTIRDIFLQVYRTICKHIYVNRAIRTSERLIFENGFIHSDGWEESKDINAARLAHFFYDLLIDFPDADQKINKIDGCCNIFKPYSKIDQQLDINIIFKEVPIPIPVALQKVASLNNGGAITDIIIIAIPRPNTTSIIIISPTNLLELFRPHLATPINTLCFIESVMMADTEWYLSPKVFNNWSSEKKSHTTKDYQYFKERRFLTHYDVSLFDELRNKLIKQLSIDRQLYEVQKTQELPARLPDNVRASKLEDAIIDMLIERNSIY
jgi:hypothetical protein